MDATPSSALAPLGPTVCTWHVLGQRSVLPTKPYLRKARRCQVGARCPACSLAGTQQRPKPFAGGTGLLFCQLEGMAHFNRPAIAQVSLG